MHKSYEESDVLLPFEIMHMVIRSVEIWGEVLEHESQSGLKISAHLRNAFSASRAANKWHWEIKKCN